MPRPRHKTKRSSSLPRVLPLSDWFAATATLDPREAVDYRARRPLAMPSRDARTARIRYADRCMASLSCIISYLRSCYEADNRQSGVGNLFDRSIRHLTFFDGDERLMTGASPWLHLEGDSARDALAEAKLYQREKTLLYCALMLVGSAPTAVTGRVKWRCAPLLLYPAQLVQVGSKFTLEICLDEQQVNTVAVANLLESAATGTVDLDELVRQVPAAPLAASDVERLVALLAPGVPHLDTAPLARFPQLDGEQEVKRWKTRLREPSDGYVCLPAAALALVPNSPRTRGVLHELDLLVEAPHHSAPLRHVLGASDTVPPPVARPSPTRVPVVLSKAQQAIVASAAREPLTMVVGPPGTGKSFTIAAVAVDHIGRGESVLVACQNDQAVGVVARMIDDLLGPNQCVIRGGKPQRVRELKQFLEQLLHGIERQQRADHGGRASDDADRRLATLADELQQLTGRFERYLANELEWGRLNTGEPRNLFRRLYRHWLLWRLAVRLSRQPDLWDFADEYERRLRDGNLQRRELLTQRIAAEVQRTLNEHRRDLAKFLRSIRTRSSTRQERLFAEIDPRLLFRTFPIWLTTIADAADLVPMETETFDVAIFDEATQCDMASCLPILQRARRAVVVGDPHQLRHVSFLADEKMRYLASEHRLTAGDSTKYHYRNKSLLDLADEHVASQRQVLFLNEHFRSMPPIIAFSNQHIYQGALSIMRLRPSTAAAQCLFGRHVADGRKQGSANPAEAAAVVDEVATLVASQTTLPDGKCQSIGILSPFRDQVDAIAEQLERRLSLEALNRHDLRVGTAHAFQGDERDVMVLSLVVDDETHPAALRFVNDDNLFNVSITRARDRQIVFYSCSVDRLPAGSLLRKYLESMQQPPAAPAACRGPASGFQGEVRQALEQRAMRVWTDYAVAGVAVDLLVEQHGRTLGIDLVGSPGESGRAVDLERYRILQRAGLALLPLPYRLWLRDQNKCLQAIVERLS